MEKGEAQEGKFQNQSDLQQVFNSIREAPKYPEGFRPIKNGTKKLRVENKFLLEKLRQIEPGEWRKVYQDGFDGDRRNISIHYFQSPSGKVFDVKVKLGWSNQ